ncbi:MAG: hypothetical protein LBI20_03585 [Holosporales bacterium]|jgi:undecaprenyl-diphosphatase|nr:hypothetical protein [Holosporales bacterium]
MIDDDVICFVLKLGQVDVIASIIILGILFNYRRADFEHAACFVCFVIVFNTLLKNVFKVPLFPHLGSGYAFPSGHMHASAIFYGYFVYKTPSHIARGVLIAILGCIGAAIVYRHFHDWYDIFGAIAFASAEIAIYHFLQTKYAPRYITIMSILSLIIIFYTLQLFYISEAHVWSAFYIFVGFLIGMRCCIKIALTELIQKFTGLLLCGGLFVVVHMYGKFSEIIERTELCLSQLNLLLFPIAIYLAIWIVSKIPGLSRQRFSEK